MGDEILTIAFSELKVGMVIAKDIEYNRRIILKKDITVTESIYNRLKKLCLIGTVDIYSSETHSTVKKIENKKTEELDKIEKDFKQISSKLKSTFDNILFDDSNSINEVRLFAKRIEEQLGSSDIVIKNIVLHGSGKDSIYRHGVDVAALSALLGEWIGMEQGQLNLLVYSALLHDIGKVKIDSNILNKDGILTGSEYKTIKSHTSTGYKVVKSIPFIDKSVSYGVLMHHERVDGSGYPLGLKGEEIHQFGKIIAIADVFDAINSNRGYKNKKAPFEALQILKTESLGKLDYEYVNIFLKHIVNYYLGERVILNTGDKCKIIQMNTNDLDRPLVLKDGEFIDLEKQRELYVKEMLL